MKLMTIALGIGLVGAGSAYATPYYVGQNLRPENNITLEFQDTVTKKVTDIKERGNIAAFELKADVSPIENLSLGANLPFYIASKNALGAAESRNAMGNVSLSGSWSQALSQSSDSIAWGYAANLGVYLPTSRKDEGSTIAGANPATDFYTYSTKAMTVHPTLGVFVENEMFLAKTNVGYGYMYIKDGISASTNKKDTSRNTFTWQAAASWKAMPNLAANLEYNTIFLDKATVGNDKKFRHALAPSISGSFSGVIASAFANVPLDETTRDIHNVAFGANIGYMF